MENEPCGSVLVVTITIYNAREDIDIIDENDMHGARKIIFRDQLYIILNDEWYNASGQKVPNPMK